MKKDYTEIECTRCNGSGEYMSDYFEHPETGSTGRYTRPVNTCMSCDGTCKRWRFFVGNGRWEYSAPYDGAYRSETE